MGSTISDISARMQDLKNGLFQPPDLATTDDLLSTLLSNSSKVMDSLPAAEFESL